MSATVAISELVQCFIEHGIEFIRFEQTDTHGISRSKTVPVKAQLYFDAWRLPYPASIRNQQTNSTAPEFPVLECPRLAGHIGRALFPTCTGS
jgi:hypothetical protein